MGSTAKLMLVGILVLVIVVALVWEKQSTDLQQASVDNDVAKKAANIKGKGGLANEVLPSLSRVSGTVAGKQSAEPEVNDEFENEFIRGTQQKSVEQQSVQTKDAPIEEPKIKKHKVVEGENLWSIAKKYYGDGSKRDLILQANKDKCKSEDLIRPGMELVIPDLSKDAPSSQPTAQSSVQEPKPMEKSVTEVSSTGKTYYTVQEGDCLSIISQKVYGTSKKWRDILEANKDILPDEQALRVGMKLYIPNSKKNN